MILDPPPLLILLIAFVHRSGLGTGFVCEFWGVGSVVFIVVGGIADDFSGAQKSSIRWCLYLSPYQGFGKGITHLWVH